MKPFDYESAKRGEPERPKLVESEPQSQNQIILSHLKMGDKITPQDALRLCGSMRLSARIYDLRSQGYDIQMRRKMVKCANGNNANVAEYFLPKRIFLK